MSPGALYVKYRQKYQHGIKTAWYRDVVRQKILHTKPFENTQSTVCEIHTLTSQGDYLNLIWTLKSFYHYSGRSYSLCIHSDGSLQQEDIFVLKNHFPNARFILKDDADATISGVLASFPQSLNFRLTNHLAPKLFDFKYYLQSERMLLMDSDILFFAHPEALINRIEDRAYRLNTVNKDAMYGYTVKVDDVKSHLGINLISFFNSGLGLIHRESIRFDWIEEFLSLPEINGHFWRIEQTLFALCSSKYGVELLPAEYDVQLKEGAVGIPSRHYVGRIRHLMYKEGIRKLQRQNFLQAIT